MIATQETFVGTINSIRTLEEMTRLPFEIKDQPASRMPNAPWEPEFRETREVLHYRVATSSGTCLGGSVAGTDSERSQQRRLISLACGQLRAEESNLKLQGELVHMTAHLHDMYEHVSVLHTVARTVAAEQDLSASIEAVVRELEYAIDAEITLSEGRAAPPVAHLSGESFKLQQSSTAGRSRPWLLAVPIHSQSGEQRLLTARRSTHENEFGSQEELVLRSVATLLENHLAKSALLDEKDRLLFAFVRSLSSAIDARDHYTRGHSERVALMSQFLAEQMNLTDDECQTVFTSGLLHDVGKIGIDDGILRKNGPLTDEQRREIERHPVVGYEILSGIPAFASLLPGVRHHHERWDGQGYPDKLSGHGIPLMARIMAVADAFDAMASDRPYRTGMPLRQVLNILLQGSGSQWCPTVISHLERSCLEFAQLWNELHTVNHTTRHESFECGDMQPASYAAARSPRIRCSAARTSLTSPE